MNKDSVNIVLGFILLILAILFILFVLSNPLAVMGS